jgi:zinc transport system substrate-binding protein
MMTFRNALATAVIGLGLACAPAPDGEDAARSETVDVAANSGALVVRAVNYPLQYFATRIGGELVDAVFPEIVGDPANWQPTAEEIGAFQEAELVLLNGANYAKWTATATLPRSRLVNTSAGFADRLITVDGVVTHSHGPEGDHSHGETAFTTWLDPALAAEHGRAIHAELSARRPGAVAQLDAGLAALERDLAALDERLRVIAQGHGSTPMLASHPVYQYLARRYELDLDAVHLEPDQPLSERDWRELEDALASRRVRVMLWEAEPLFETRERLEAAGVSIAVYAPCANVPGDGDWIEVMSSNVDNLAEALGGLRN